LRIQSDCSILVDEKTLLNEIAHTEKDIEVWAYKSDKTREGELLSFEYAIRQEDRWYEVFQREVLINKEEFIQLRIIRHTDTSQIPFNVYECVVPLQGKELEQAWDRIAIIHYPFSVAIYHDRLTAFCEQKDGVKKYIDLRGDIAIGFESDNKKVYLQSTNIPYMIKMCQSENDIDECYDVWGYHISTEDEVNCLKTNIQKSEDYYLCRQLESFNRIKKML